MARKDEARRWEVKMTISDQELFCNFDLWDRIFVDSQINHKFVNPQICVRGEIWECSNMGSEPPLPVRIGAKHSVTLNMGSEPPYCQ